MLTILPARVVELYTALGRMRVVSLPEVFKCVQHAIRKILDTYCEPSKTFAERRIMVRSEDFDLRSHFAEACHAELESLSAHQF